MSDCPYPPSDPFCHQAPTTTTTVLHVVVDNTNDFGSVDAGSADSTGTVQAIQHQTHVIAIGFTFGVVAILFVGMLIFAAITGLRGKNESSNDRGGNLP